MHIAFRSDAVHEGVDYKQNEKGSQEHLEQL